MERRSALETLELVGGRLCLDFTNTVGTHGPDNPYEYLNGDADLVGWSVHARAISVAEAQTLLDRAGAEPATAANVVRRAIALREAIYRIFSAQVAARGIPSTDLDLLNAELARAMAHARVETIPGGLAWSWGKTGDLDRVLWPVARSAAELLTAPELERVGECAGEQCEWLYLDVSKNRSRRWCDMRNCGNRAKVRRHYERVRKAAPPGG
jgi:predicted RNA-binding Zn ribbon-like protein